MSYIVDRSRYGLQLLDDETVKTSVAHMESHGIWFGWPLNGEVAHIINSTNGVNSTGEWDALLASMARVKRSTHLLAWYVCDDCDNGTPYPLSGVSVQAIHPCLIFSFKLRFH